jgi:hypothetical protein
MQENKDLFWNIAAASKGLEGLLCIVERYCPETREDVIEFHNIQEQPNKWAQVYKRRLVNKSEKLGACVKIIKEILEKHPTPERKTEILKYIQKELNNK